MPSPAILLITCVRNEAPTIASMIRSVVDQTYRPGRWLIMDDGSTDGSEKIVEQARTKHDWIGVHTMPDSGYLDLGAHVVQLVKQGIDLSRDFSWDYLAKVDADLELAPDYFETLMAAFAQDPDLGIASGKAIIRGPGHPPAWWTPDYFPLGMARVYRRACWGDLAETPAARLYDVYDVYLAKMIGWKTTSRLDTRVFLERRVDARMPNQLARRWASGDIHYRLGYLPAYFLLRAVRSMWDETPPVLAGLAMFGGYLASALRRRQPLNPKLRDYIRSDQRARLTIGSLRAYLESRVGHKV
jgi:biofilm PGA synthesis N-glycosyltransferase PgaC